MTQKELEQEWARYKYWVMGKSHQAYREIRALFKDNQVVDPAIFNEKIAALKDQPLSIKNEINALEHVWGYFKKTADHKTKARFFKALEAFRAEKMPLVEVKAILYELAQTHQETYLLDSYYFEEFKDKEVNDEKMVASSKK